MRKGVFLAIVMVVFLASIPVFGQGGVDYKPIEQQQYVIEDQNVGDDLYIFVLSMRNLEFFDVHVPEFDIT